jgi:serine/threonine-protein kinase
MQASASDELIDLITRYQLIEPEPLWQYLAGRGGAAGLPGDMAEAVAEMVAAGLLSTYQGEQLGSGDVSGLVVGKYRILDRLGPASSTVYLCERRSGGGNRLAVKILPLGERATEADVERFRREAEALARLDHPGIVSIKEFGEEPGRLYLMMEHIEGESLAELVARQGPLAPVPAARLIQEAAVALAHVHQAGLVHRNLHPDHLLWDCEGKVRLIDLGLARFLDDPGGALTMNMEPGQVLGSVEYLPPEQVINGHAVDGRADVYGLGAIFYFLLTGKAPFSQHALLRLAAGVVTHPQPLAQLRPDVPRPLAAIIERMMALDPQQRYQDAREIPPALGDWLQEVAPPPLVELTRRTPPQMPAFIPGVELLPELAVEPIAEPAAPAPSALVPLAVVVGLLTFLAFLVFRLL